MWMKLPGPHRPIPPRERLYRLHPPASPPLLRLGEQRQQQGEAKQVSVGQQGEAAVEQGPAWAAAQSGLTSDPEPQFLAHQMCAWLSLPSSTWSEPLQRDPGLWAGHCPWPHWPLSLGFWALKGRICRCQKPSVGRVELGVPNLPCLLLVQP